MILRTELRRSVAPVAGIGLLVVSVGLLYSLPGPWWKRTAPWDEQWIGLAQWTRYLAVFLLPLVLGVSAWQGLRDKRSGVSELFATTPKAIWRRVLPTVGALALALTAGYLVLLVVGGVQVARTASYFHLKWLPVAGVMVLALVGLALLGVGIGRLVPSLVTPPLLAVATLFGQVAFVGTNWRLLAPTFESADITVFTTVSVPVTLAQALWFVGIGATGFGLFVATRATTRVAALLPVALTAAVAVPVLSGTSPVVADSDAQALVCDDDGPRVCVLRAHADYLPTLVGPAREALALLDKLPSPPTSVVELPSYEGYRPASSDVFPVYFEFGTRDDSAEIMPRMLGGRYTPNCVDYTDWEAVDRETSARVLVGSWFTGELTQGPDWEYMEKEVQEEIRQAWQALQALPPAEQRARVAALWEAAFYCRGELTL